MKSILGRCCLVGILLVSVCGAVGGYFGIRGMSSSGAKQTTTRSNKHLTPTNSANTNANIVPGRHTTKFISMVPAASKPKVPPNIPDVLVSLTPKRHHGSYYHYSFTGQDESYTGTNKATGTKQLNSYKFGETQTGFLEVAAKNLDKVIITTYITWQSNCTAKMAYFQKPMSQFVGDFQNKKVDNKSVHFAIRAHGLANCPSIDFYVSYKAVADGNSTDLELGSYNVYNMDHGANSFFASWLFITLVSVVILIVVAIITYLTAGLLAGAAAGVYSFFAGLFNLVAFGALTSFGGYLLSDYLKTSATFSRLLTFFTGQYDSHGAGEQSHHANSKLPWNGGTFGNLGKKPSSPYGGDILNDDPSRQKPNDTVRYNEFLNNTHKFFTPPWQLNPQNSVNWLWKLPTV